MIRAFKFIPFSEFPRTVSIMPYVNNFNEEWTFQANSGLLMFLFTDFEIEYHSRCVYDWVEIVDGNGRTLLGKPFKKEN